MNEQKSSEEKPLEGSEVTEPGPSKTETEEGQTGTVGSSPTDAVLTDEPTDADPSDEQKSENVTDPSKTAVDEEITKAVGRVVSRAISLSRRRSEFVNFTIDDVVDKAGYGRFQKLLTFLAGLGWLADAFEIIILSIIGEMIACDWVMEKWQNAVMTSAVFAGMAVGAPIFGNLADKYGRRTILAGSVLILFIFGASSAAAPNYTWILILRTLMGFSLGGMAQAVTLCSEYYPTKYRGSAGFYLSYYWSLGTLGVIAFAWIIMDLLNNWRVFLFIAAVPALIVFLCMKWYPESARYYLVSNQPEKALKILNKLCKSNKMKMPRGKLVQVNAYKQRGKILDLLKPQIRKTTLLFWYIWVAVACAYYGIALTTPLIVSNGSLIATAEIRENTSLAEDFRSPLPCKKYTDQNFLDLFWTSAAEFPGLLFFSLIVNHFSRKKFLGTACLVNAFLMLFLMLEMKPPIALLIVLFICRGLVCGVFQLLFIMTSEAFPTTLRASAMGTGSGCARIGGLIIPYLAQVTVTTKPIPSMFVLALVYALAGVAAFMLPIETQGRHMEDILEKNEENVEKVDNAITQNKETAESNKTTENKETTENNETTEKSEEKG